MRFYIPEGKLIVLGESVNLIWSLRFIHLSESY